MADPMANMWRCTECGFPNPQTYLVCVSCRRARKLLTVAELRSEPYKDGFPLVLDTKGRVSRQSLHMQMAFLWALRSEDPRLQVGVVITSVDMKRVLSIGYNGPAKGIPASWIRDEPGNSGCLHAEDNAIAACGSNEEKIIFVTHLPCEMCAHRIVNANIKKVYYCFPYRDDTAILVFNQCGIEFVKFAVPTRIIKLSQ